MSRKSLNKVDKNEHKNTKQRIQYMKGRDLYILHSRARSWVSALEVLFMWYSSQSYEAHQPAWLNITVLIETGKSFAISRKGNLL